MESEWRVWDLSPIFYKVSLRLWSDWAGAGYKFARRNGSIARFFTRRGAQRFADKLNADERATTQEKV